MGFRDADSQKILIDRLTYFWSNRFPEMSPVSCREAVRQLIKQINEAGFDIVYRDEGRTVM